ncbi:MAG: translation elongation factor Ts [Cellvibrionales bacterium TMED49]|nr:MAG: translation elongation factor Ts [Cellvibrionales bacterium TMED49]
MTKLVTPLLVKDLRERTGLGMMECKRALVASSGDIEDAIASLRKSSGLKAAKKASRTAADGLIGVASSDDYGVIIEVNSETDFVARDDNFQGFVQHILTTAFDTRETKPVTLLAHNNLEAKRNDLIQKIGENILLRRVKSIKAPVVGSYLHTNCRIGVLVGLTGGSPELARHVAMHIAAVNPAVVRSNDMSKSVLEAEKDIYLAQARDSGKPEEIVQKMVAGRVAKFLKESSLIDQPFVKDPEKTIAQLVGEANADITEFIRFEVGEGIVKDEVDFAAEVAEQVKNIV